MNTYKIELFTYVLMIFIHVVMIAVITLDAVKSHEYYLLFVNIIPIVIVMCGFYVIKKFVRARRNISESNV